MPLLLLGKRKLPPPRLTSTFSTVRTSAPTRHCSSKRRISKESATAGSFICVGGTQWQSGYGSPSPGRRTDTRADNKFERVFADLSGKMAVPRIGGKRYILIVRDDHTRFTRVYILAKKSDAASAFESFLAEVRADGTPSAVMCVRSDNGGEFSGGKFGTVCRKRGIKQEFTSADSPKYNGVAERALALISDTALAARIPAQVLYPDAPSYPSLWAGAVSWACNALNRTATKANPGNKSPYEIWHGSPPLAGFVFLYLPCRLLFSIFFMKDSDQYVVTTAASHRYDVDFHRTTIAIIFLIIFFMNGSICTR